MLGRRKTVVEDEAPARPPREGAKNRPTPRRSVAQAANRRPLVPTDRKAAAKDAREKMREERVRQRAALQTGDEAHLPSRDKGPTKRFVRDVVDSRRNVGEYYLVLALVAVGLTLVPSFLTQDVQQQAQMQVVATLVLWGTVLVCAADGFVLNRLLKRRLVERFGEDVVLKGNVGYGVMRAFQIRRLRLPKPQVERGAAPR